MIIAGLSYAKHVVFQSWQKLQYRMSLLVNEVRKSELTTYKTTIMALINAVIFANENIPDRMRIRNEFLGEYTHRCAEYKFLALEKQGSIF